MHGIHRQSDVRPRIMSCSCGTAVAAVARLPCVVLLWPLGPLEHGLHDGSFASGGDQVLRTDVPSVGSG